MCKKIIFLSMLIVASPCVALWEMPAAIMILCASLRTPMGRKVASYCAVRLKDSSTKYLASCGKKPILIAQDQMSSWANHYSVIACMMASSVLTSAKNSPTALAKKVREFFSSVQAECVFANAAAMRASQAYQLLCGAVKSSVDFKASTFTQKPLADEENTYSKGEGVAYSKTETRVEQQNMAYGLFPRITNNYYSSSEGSSSFSSKQHGKTQFWKGAAIGSLGTAYLVRKD